MANTLEQKIAIGKETFNLYNSRDKDNHLVFSEQAQKYGLAQSTVRGHYHYYKNRTVSPKPTEEELQKNKEIVNQALIEANRKSTEMMRDKNTIYDWDLIDALLALKTGGDLRNYCVDSEFNCSYIEKHINKAFKSDRLTTAQLNKLKNIKRIFLELREMISSLKRDKINAKQSEINRTRNIEIITEILEEILISGTSIEEVINDFPISMRSFNLYLPYLAEGTDIQKTLCLEYQKSVIAQEQDLEQKYLEIVYYLENGVSKNGIKTYFNYLDYYRLSKMAPTLFYNYGLKLIKKGLLTRKQHSLVQTFFDINSLGSTILTEEKARNFSYSINGETVSEVVKEQIIDYFNVNGFVLTENLLAIAIEEYLKGINFLNEFNLNRI